MKTTQENKFAIIHKNSCCVAWKVTHRVIDHTINGIVTMPSWYEWTGSDDLPDCMPADEYWLDRYKQLIVDAINDCEDPQLESHEFNLAGYVEFVRDESANGSREECLAEIAQNETL